MVSAIARSFEPNQTGRLRDNLRTAPVFVSIYYLTADRIKLLDVPVSAAVGCIMRLGVGSHELLDSRPQLGAELVRYNAHHGEQAR